MSEPKVGDRIQWTRAITEADVRRFTELSGDRGDHHVERDAEGRLLAHGLLTATLPTKLGGDLNFIARKMEFEFIKAVYSGDALVCKGVVESVVAQSARWKVAFSFEVTNQADELVMRGRSSGMILKKSVE